MSTPIVNQGAFTAVAEIKKDKIQALRALLTPIGDNADKTECPIDLRKLQTIHFMRWVILDGTSSVDGNPRYNMPPCLVLSTNYDEPLEKHLDDLISMGGQHLRDIYSHCEEFDDPSTDLKNYLRNREAPYEAFYVGTRGRTVQEIRKEKELRNGIEKFLDQRGVKPNESAVDIRKAIQDFVANDVNLRWTTQDVRSAFQWRWFFFDIRYVLVILGGILGLGLGAVGAWLWGFWGLTLPFVCAGALAVLLGVLALLWLGIVRLYEKRDLAVGPPKVPIMGASVEEQKKREDQIIQNQLSNIVWVKPGWFRLMTLRLVLALINVLGRYYYVRGALGGIPTIHFARWVILDNKRVLFFSNFDGSWENYLGDFIDKASSGLTGIWSNCIGCPPSRWLFKDGAADEPAFKTWVRENQLVTQVWYSNYEDLTVENINNNSLIRLGLSGAMNEKQAQDWLDRL